MSVADPGFPRRGGGGANPREVYANLLFGFFLAKNHVKMNKLDQEDTSLAPPPPSWICLYMRHFGASSDSHKPDGVVDKQCHRSVSTPIRVPKYEFTVMNCSCPNPDHATMVQVTDCR